MNIPKKVHYCWFGPNPMPELTKKCIDSWKKFLPEYELVLWNEYSFDVNANTFTRQAYEQRKYAFVTDYVRLFVLYNEGGIYCDTDVEVVSELDDFLMLEGFSGFESNNNVPTGIMGAMRGNDIIKDLLNYYEEKQFLLNDGSLDLETNTSIITKYFIGQGLKLNNETQEIAGFTLFSSDYFCPINYTTGELHTTNNTKTIHWFAGSWLSNKQRFKRDISRFLIKFFGEETYRGLKRISGIFNIRNR
jgi:hypothetical protein